MCRLTVLAYDIFIYLYIFMRFSSFCFVVRCFHVGHGDVRHYGVICAGVGAGCSFFFVDCELCAPLLSFT